MSVQAQASAANSSDASIAAPPAALRIVDEALHVEAERSYLAVSSLHACGVLSCKMDTRVVLTAVCNVSNCG